MNAALNLISPELIANYAAMRGAIRSEIISAPTVAGTKASPPRSLMQPPAMLKKLGP